MTAPPASSKRVTVTLLICVLLIGSGGLGFHFLRPYWQERTAHRVFDSGAMMQERRIYNACQAFASIRGNMPASLDDLVPDFLPDPNALRDPDHPKAGEIGYRYYASGSTGTEPPSAIFLATKAIVHGGELIIRFNGKSDFVPPTDPETPAP